MTFTQQGEEKDTGDLSKITCYHCGEKGHHSCACLKKEGKNREQVHSNIAEEWENEDDDDIEYTYHQTNEDGNWDERLLIDSQSTVDIFKDKSFITGINTVEKPCQIKCHAGSVLINKKNSLENNDHQTNPFCVFWLDRTPIKTDGSEKFGPRELICH